LGKRPATLPFHRRSPLKAPRVGNKPQRPDQMVSNNLQLQVACRILAGE
jgi:hypothetical protein